MFDYNRFIRINAVLMAILFFLSFPLSAVEFNNPNQIYKYINKSAIHYTFESLEEPIAIPNYSENLSRHGFYRAIQDGSLQVLRMRMNKKAAKYQKKAEKFYKKKNFSKARKYFYKALKLEPTLYINYTYIGQTFEQEEKYNEAKICYLQAIEKNYIDYMAHWFLALLYMRQGKAALALDEVIVANILNRNNPQLRQSLEHIFAMNNKIYWDWVFAPQIRIVKTGNKSIKILGKDDWLWYAMVKALWQYDPEYRKTKNTGLHLINVNEEIEALACYFSLILAKKKKIRGPHLVSLQAAFKAKAVYAYAIYEIILTKYPEFAYTLSIEGIKQIAEYVRNVRK